MQELHVKSLLPVRLDKYLMEQFPALGLGVLIALPIAVVLLRRQLGGMLRRHWACLLYTSRCV